MLRGGSFLLTARSLLTVGLCCLRFGLFRLQLKFGLVFFFFNLRLNFGLVHFAYGGNRFGLFYLRFPYRPENWVWSFLLTVSLP